MKKPLYNPFPLYETSRYFYAMCSDELDSMVPSTLALPNGTHNITYTRMNHPYYLHIPLVKIKFRSNSFPKIAILGNRLMEGCFPGRYKTDPFKFQVKRYLFSITTLTSLFAFSYVHTTHT